HHRTCRKMLSVHGYTSTGSPCDWARRVRFFCRTWLDLEHFARSIGIFVCSGLEHIAYTAYTTPPLRISGLAFGPGNREFTMNCDNQAEKPDEAPIPHTKLELI